MTKWILLIVGILIAFYFYIKSIIDSITVKFKLEDLSFEDINLRFVNKSIGSVKIRLGIIIKFFSLFNIDIKDLKIEAFYNNILVAKSSDNIIENNKSLNLVKNVDNIVYHTFDFQLNASLVQLLYRVKNNLAYIVDYNISLKIFGIPFNTNDSYNSISK